MSNELGSVAAFIKRAAQQTGFDRERYVESKIPEDFSKVVVVYFFGDFRSEMILSSLILHRYIKKCLPGKYVILCSWPGHAGLFPYVDEFWSLGDQMLLQDLQTKAVRFENRHKSHETVVKNLRKFFDVQSWEEMDGYYQDGLTKQFFDHFDVPVRFLPEIPSPKMEFVKEVSRRNAKTVFVHPQRTMRSWNKIDIDFVIDVKFWKMLVEKLLQAGLVLIVYQNYSTYDLSSEFGDRCMYVTDNNVLSIMSQMRLSSCVLDVFSGISRLAVMARCPFVVVDERNRYVASREGEINDLCLEKSMHYRYILSFSTILQHGNYTEFVNHIAKVIDGFCGAQSSKELPTPSESYEEVPYSVVRKHRAKKMGIRFIKVERLVI
jgi:hypothetical protein